MTSPYFAYHHNDYVPASDTRCPKGGSSIAGLAFEFYSGGPYPAEYDGALFFADYSRDCIWYMPKDKDVADGLPLQSQVKTFLPGAANPVDLEVFGGELFYVDFDGGTIRRIQYNAENQPPVAVAKADPTSGAAPLTVNFDGSASSDPEGGTITYAWDLDGDEAYDDSTAVNPTRIYESGTYTERLEVTDSGGASDISDPIVITAGNTPPTATIDLPPSTLTWSVGQEIEFLGSATDEQDGTLPGSALDWDWILHHGDHTHPIQSFLDVASGTFIAPDHQYPSHLELKLTATDSGGLKDTESVLLYPQTVDLTLQSQPSGLQLVLNGSGATTPFKRTVILGSKNTISAPSPQKLSGKTYRFVSWSDGGAQTHDITANASATYEALYRGAK